MFEGINKWAILLFGVLLWGCELMDDQVVCTEEFRIISAKIVGGDFDNFYTIRKSTSDTIVYAPNNIYTGQDLYPVLDDSYQSEMVNSREVFIFELLNDNEKIISEEYVIEADECHISLVEGRKEIDLSKL